jgi:hypothetical protein
MYMKQNSTNMTEKLKMEASGSSELLNISTWLYNITSLKPVFFSPAFKTLYDTFMLQFPTP